MTMVVSTNQSLQHLWQVLDQGELWQEGEAAARTQAAVAELDGRLSGSQTQASNYLRFLRRSVSAVSASAQATFAKVG
jgi:hypothetical protein